MWRKFFGWQTEICQNVFRVHDKKKGKKKDEGDQPKNTDTFFSDVITSFDNSSVEHLLFTSDTHTSLVACSNRWIIDSGASEHMTSDQSLLDKLEGLTLTTRVTMA